MFFRSSNPVGSQTTAAVRWFLPDANNNITMLTDGASSAQQLYAYQPYGYSKKVLRGEDNTQQFTARENDGTGLYYYRNRYYMPTCARYISEDPIGWASGQTNNYAYVGGNPVQFTDPEGTCEEPGLENVCVECMFIGVGRLGYIVLAKAIPAIARTAFEEEVAQATWANATRNGLKDAFRPGMANRLKGFHQPSVKNLLDEGKSYQQIINGAGKTNLGANGLGLAIGGVGVTGPAFQPGCDQ